MSKRNKIIIGAVLLLLVGIVGVFKVNLHNGYKISITNQTNSIVRDLEIRYKTGERVIESISQLQPNDSWECTIDTNHMQGENAIILLYNDKNGNSYEESIMGYLEKGYGGKSKVSIINVDENGKLEIEIH